MRVEWMPWTDTAFQKALTSRKPVLLSITATWCHWCHQMDLETYSKKPIIDFIHQNFVAIRVDTDKRPDINSRYNAGGWPTAVVMDGNGIPLSSTLFENEQSFLGFLQSSLVAFHEITTGSPFSNLELLESELEEKPSQPLSPDDLAQVETRIIQKTKSMFDRDYGGFGAGQKFPHVDVLRFLVSKTERFKNPELDFILQTTLEAIQNRGLHDKVEHGFFRYCTNREWSQPHYEKMLEDNAQLAELFSRASRVYNRSDFLQTAKHTVSFIENTFLDPSTGLFFASQDADETYYRKPLIQRQKTQSPKVDPSIYCSWNAMMVPAYLCLGQTDTGIEIAKQLWRTFYRPYRVLHEAGSTEQLFYLKDAAWLLNGLIQCHETKKHDFSELCVRLATDIIDRLWDARQNAFCDSHAHFRQIGLLAQPLYPLSENSLMIQNLLSLSRITQDSQWSEYANQTFVRFYNDYEKRGLFGAPYGWAAQLLRSHN